MRASGAKLVPLANTVFVACGNKLNGAHHKYDLTLELNAIAEGILLVRPYRTRYSYINHQGSRENKSAYTH
ncbi:hypothetical protein ACOI22_08840 [Glaciecola sp. 2405UD65-10]|uniref:hypothetical protein n=1 Tax=Glaciecola sp. 2405UD65-10 TaxID=3397244 RepID=UPI003B5B09D1